MKIGPQLEKGALQKENSHLEEGSPQILHADLCGESLEVKVEKGASIIECLINEGYNPPYSCLEGVCTACLAKVTEGAVEQRELGVLTEDNIRNHEVLTCQAHPLTPVVKVQYDDL